MKSLLIEDTTVDERMQIVKEALGGFGNCDCEGIDSGRYVRRLYLRQTRTG